MQICEMFHCTNRSANQEVYRDNYQQTVIQAGRSCSHAVSCLKAKDKQYESNRHELANCNSPRKVCT